MTQLWVSRNSIIRDSANIKLAGLFFVLYRDSEVVEISLLGQFS
jgi:hypothetical protein